MPCDTSSLEDMGGGLRYVSGLKGAPCIVCVSLSCEEMREDSHASFMLEYTHGVGDKNRLCAECVQLLGLMRVHMELVHVRIPLPRPHW